MRFILLLLFLPFMELYIYFYVGRIYGWPQLFLWTAVTFFIGKSIIRRQNFIMAATSSSGAAINEPLSQVLIVISGFLIMLPGLITDALGLLLLVPGVRSLLLALFKKHLNRLMKSGHLRTFTSSPVARTSSDAGDMVIDVDYDIVKTVETLSNPAPKN